MGSGKLRSQSEHRASPAHNVISSHAGVHDRSLTVRAARGASPALARAGQTAVASCNDVSNSTHTASGTAGYATPVQSAQPARCLLARAPLSSAGKVRRARLGVPNAAPE